LFTLGTRLRSHCIEIHLVVELYSSLEIETEGELFGEKTIFRSILFPWEDIETREGDESDDDTNTM
jgi:hypothetical protein